MKVYHDLEKDAFSDVCRYEVDALLDCGEIFICEDCGDAYFETDGSFYNFVCKNCKKEGALLGDGDKEGDFYDEKELIDNGWSCVVPETQVSNHVDVDKLCADYRYPIVNIEDNGWHGIGYVSCSIWIRKDIENG